MVMIMDCCSRDKERKIAEALTLSTSGTNTGKPNDANKNLI